MRQTSLYTAKYLIRTYEQHILLFNRYFLHFLKSVFGHFHLILIFCVAGSCMIAYSITLCATYVLYITPVILLWYKIAIVLLALLITYTNYYIVSYFIVYHISRLLHFYFSFCWGFLKSKFFFAFFGGLFHFSHYIKVP